MQLIAEIGVNHEGRLDLAKKMIDLLAQTNCQIVKFQTYKAEYLASKDAKAYWDTSKENIKNQRQLFSKYDNFEIRDYIYLAEYAADRNIEFMTTFFDTRTLDSLAKYVKRFKIASADLTNFELVNKLCDYNKPIILSTGAASFEEIDGTLNVLEKNGVRDITLLHCVLRYPTEEYLSSLNRIIELGKEFPQCNIGYSDHTVPTEDHLVQITASLLGASILEKHFTFDKNFGGNDHYHSYDKDDVVSLYSKLERIELMRNFEPNNFLEIQKDARREARRGLYYFRDLFCGETIRIEDIISLRPSTGIEASRLFEVIGKKLTKDVKKDSAVKIEDLA